MNLSRREFLIACGALSGVVAYSQINQLVFAQTAAERDILIMVFLRGGCDGLNLLAPVDDANYAAARGTDLKVPDKGNEPGLNLNKAFEGNDFRLHPKAAPLKELYDSGVLAFVHACGLTNATRSHFDAQSLIERGTANDNTMNITTGWLARHLMSINAHALVPVISTSSTNPDLLMGYVDSVAITDPTSFKLQGHATYGPQQQQLLRRFYQGNTPLSLTALRTLDAIDIIDGKMEKDQDGNVKAYTPEGNLTYPNDDYSTGFTTSLQIVARLIKMDIGLQVACIDLGGWDTHEYQASVFPGLVDSLSKAISVFYNDLYRYQKQLTVVALSEFGRRFKQNESGGSDHGHGNVMMVLGGNVNGGRMYGKWPGLANEQLDERVDLAVTTDYRTVLAEVVEKRLKNPDINHIFPGFTQYSPLGIFS